MNPIIYRLDKDDRLVGVNAEWDRFAGENGGPRSAQALGRPIWDFIADATTRALYDQVLKRARAGFRVTFPFRCDSPSLRRRLELDAKTDGLEIEITVRALSLEKRPPQALLDPARPASKEILRMCGWCKRIPVEGRWLEVEDAAEKLKLLEAFPLPALSHGICERCEAGVLSALDDENKKR